MVIEAMITNMVTSFVLHRELLGGKLKVRGASDMGFGWMHHLTHGSALGMAFVRVLSLNKLPF